MSRLDEAREAVKTAHYSLAIARDVLTGAQLAFDNALDELADAQREEGGESVAVS